ncbi:hypothetical protein CO051_06615, partial [Candidatus Roizmanbacteria bacterium CG_4_9_14_0_2_um_filter_39_13]|uniref:DUF4145 domain-containing protein n=2 Tax=Candidatus Roizmaniibacteriota TaxID=1752723 RepID=A0A2M8KPK2_9BACT
MDELFNKGYITQHLKETAHEIRHFGNFGAHPQNDILGDTTSEDAEIIKQLTFSLISAIYIIPFKTEAMNNPVPRAQGIKDYNSRNCISSGFFP